MYTNCEKHFTVLRAEEAIEIIKLVGREQKDHSGSVCVFTEPTPRSTHTDTHMPLVTHLLWRWLWYSLLYQSTLPLTAVTKMITKSPNSINQRLRSIGWFSGARADGRWVLLLMER